MPSLLSVSQAARLLAKQHGIDPGPKLLSDLIYRRQLPAEAVTALAGRRLIRADHLDEVADLLKQRARSRRKTRGDS